jgi:hypothetical protein
MLPDKTIQPSEEIEKEAKNNLVHIAPHTDTQDNQQPRVLSPDELDHADKTAEQKANALLAEATIKNMKDLTNSDDPYWHSSTTAGMGNLSQRYGFVNRRYQRVFVTCVVILWVIGFIVYFIAKYIVKN